MASNFNITNVTKIHFDNTSSAEMNLAQELEPEPAMIFRLCVSGLICIIGVVGNIAVCIVTTCDRKRSAVSLYILNLAIADLGILTVCYPLTLVKSADPLHWPLGKFVCNVIYPLSDIFYGASIASIVAIAIDRYRAIVLSMRIQNSLQTVKWAISVIWASSFMTIAFPLFFVMVYIDDKSRDTIDCTPRWSNVLYVRLYVGSLTLLFYATPLYLILWCYRQIAREIYKSKKLHKKILHQCRPNILSKRRRDQNERALKILVPVVAVFAITMLPFHVFKLCLVFATDLLHILPYPWLVFNVCTILLLSNSSANPIIYSMVSADFRKSIKRALSMQWHLLRSYEATIPDDRTGYGDKKDTHICMTTTV